MQKRICLNCEGIFSCYGDSSCWCTKLPNMRKDFKFTLSCLCPSCLTDGKAKQITQQRKNIKEIRQKNKKMC